MKHSTGYVMRRFLLFFVILVIAGIFSARSFENKSLLTTPDSLQVLEPKDYYKSETELINTIISRYHYNKINLNDSLSEEIFTKYINTLDRNKSYFLASDIKKFEQYKDELDDLIKTGDLQPAYDIFEVYRKRANDRIDYVLKTLKKKFDFTIDEYYEPDREKEQWPADDKEANEIWRKRIKNDALNLTLAGKDPDSLVETLTKRYESYRRAINQYNSEDIYQLFLNAYTETIDPHTNYFSPQTSENFKIDMSLSLEGIGAQLRNEDEYTSVVDIIPGGPAYKSGLLHRNDKIIGVAQGDDGEMVDIIGWRVTDVVQLIRGPKGTTVRLLILPADEINSVQKEIKLVRDKVKLEEQAAKKKIIDIKENGVSYKIGVIDLPAFYSDFDAMQRGDKNYKSTTRDVRKLLEELKAEKVDGVIMDLRNNGGGSLNEAIDLTGLFIKSGPVVQVRDSDGKVQVGDDKDTGVVYAGPLAVLINRFSASATEIFTGAIQDYNRGIIVGERSYGKGTVQNLIDLNRLVHSSDNDTLGEVKITIAKYYRINGGSTQDLGVIPDISYPATIDTTEVGESSDKSALPWDHISATTYQPLNDVKPFLPLLRKEHEQRVEKSAEFDYLLEDLASEKKERDQKLISLNEDVRKKEKKKEEEEKFQRENERRKAKGIKLLQKGEKVEKSSAPDDLYLDETGRVLANLIAVSVG
jgi:carboxyl-terminal processing protease